MKFERLAIPDVILLRSRRHEDHRGFFAEIYRQDQFQDAGIDGNFLQDNLSFTRARGVVRGLHWQKPPYAQAKLVRCLRGEIFDVSVDIRRGSPTYGRHVSVTLSAESPTQVYIPTGFAHGFCSLTEECLVQYKVTAYYAGDCEGGLVWNDKALAIDWPIEPDRAEVSDRDRRWAAFPLLASPFSYAG